MLNPNMCVTTDTLVMIRLHKKADLQVNCTRDRKVHEDKKSFDLGKNGCHRAGDLSIRSIVVVSDWHETLAVYNFLKICNNPSSGTPGNIYIPIE